MPKRPVLFDEEKLPSRKRIKPNERVFTEIPDKLGWLATSAGDQVLRKVVDTLNQNSKRLGLSSLFVGNKDENRVEIKKSDFELWQDKLSSAKNERKSTPKNKTQKRPSIPANERLFEPLSDDPNTLATQVVNETLTIVANTLNKNALRLKLGKIFRINKETNCVEVSREDFDKWKNEHLKIDSKEEASVQKPKTTPTSPFKRNFYQIGGNAERLATEPGAQTVDNVARALNKNANNHGFDDIFVINREDNRVEVLASDYNHWLASAKEKKKGSSRLLASERVFLTLEEDAEIFATIVEPGKAWDVARNLNRNANKLGFDKIFKHNSIKNRVEISKGDFELWQNKCNLSLREQTTAFGKRNVVSGKKSEYVSMKERKFYSLSDSELATDAGSQSTIDVVAALNKSSRKLDLGNIFRTNSKEKRAEVDVSDYRIWLERHIDSKPHSQVWKDKLDELHEEIPEWPAELVHVGIARKYLDEELKLFMLPQAAKEEGINRLPNRLILEHLSQTELVKRHAKNLTVGNSSLCFMTTRGELSVEDKVIFIFAGRNEGARYPLMPGDCRVVAVMTPEESASIQLPQHIDVLVMNELSSPSHGIYQNLGAINSRRIAAMLLAYQANLPECIFMDDNLTSVNTSEQILEWFTLYETLKKEMRGRVCTSIPTHQGRKPYFKNDTLGSKLFMIDMTQLKTKFTMEEVFTLFYPEHCTNWWTEDYVMQLMLVAAFGREAVGIFDSEALNLTRMVRLKNASAKQFHKANIHLSQTPAELMSQAINKNNLSQEKLSWIEFTLTTLRRIVEENIEYHQRRAKGIVQTDLLRQHARANGVIVEELKNEIILDNCREAIKNRVTESLDACPLYLHQKEAIKSIITSTKDYGVIDMATGSGKTRVQIVLSELVLNVSGVKPIFIVSPTQQLVQQFYEDYLSYIQDCDSKLLKCQIIKVSSKTQDVHSGVLLHNNSLDSKKVILIFCQASFLRYVEGNGKIIPEFLFLDECHKIRDDNLIKIRNAYSGKTNIIGLSATVSSSENLLYKFTRVQAVDNKIISPYIFDKKPNVYSKDAVKTELKNLATTLQTHLHPNGEVLCSLKGVIYLPNISDISEAQRQLQSLTSVKIFTAHSQDKNYILQIKNFVDHKGPAVIFAVGMLRLGFSDSSLDYAWILRNAKRPEDVKQIAGRVMRYRSGKIGYVLGFKDVNTEQLELLCDESALENADVKYLRQSKRVSSPPIIQQYNRFRGRDNGGAVIPTPNSDPTNLIYPDASYTSPRCV
ncbi:MAG: DEAD/DEAH box helicase family protein [Gammaproteobacteria bacterium]